MRRSILLPALAVLLLAPFAAPSRAQGIPEPVPGAHITNGSYPWAVDVFEGRQQLVPIHHSNVGLNNHKGANVAGGLAGSVFYKPKMTTELAGVHARVALHTDKPVFYVHGMDDESAEGAPTNLDSSWAVVRAKIDKDHRTLARISFTQITGSSKRSDAQVDIDIERLGGGWLKITPKQPLAEGEYALQPVAIAQNTYSTVVFDFSIDPKAPNSPEAQPAAK